MIRRPSRRSGVTRLLLCLLALAALAPAATAQSVSPTFTLTGDLQSLTDSWASWGRDPVNSRFNPFATRIRRSNVHRLELKWVFAFPDGVTSASSQPAVVGDTVYVNSGYSAFGPGTSLSGNVLLAFTLRGN
jgi:glucose dehydrogenase